MEAGISNKAYKCKKPQGIGQEIELCYEQVRGVMILVDVYKACKI
ncbi:hypothetical protein SAMN04488522_101246 [Pedobacter caeni]|uniref:Uncharacterized protein n=1 Tax=Pedobacter caeni TaxID=288992 RepID=A0A1M4TM96_9SPHI|nr:hypothetical protein SAMN04488522_101246 [Pedobacter caeni]